MDGFEFDTTTLALPLFVDDHADRDLRLRHGHPQRTLRKRQEIPSGHDPANYVTTRIMAHGRTTARRCRCRSCTAATSARRPRAAAALRLRLLRHGDAGLVLGQPPVAGRPRLRLCHRPYPRRRRQGLGLVSRRQAREEDQHLRRFRRGGRARSSPSATPRPGASSAMAAAPAAC